MNPSKGPGGEPALTSRARADSIPASCVALVVAVATNGVIGKDGDLPWRLPDELKYFKRLTVGHTLIMGRKTFESIGRPLPRRRTLILSRDPGFRAQGVEVVKSLEQALELAASAPPTAPKPQPSLFVVGGASVYAAALPMAGHLFMTRVHTDMQGDVYFPEISWKNWQLQASERHEIDDRHEHAFTMEHYRRTPPLEG